MNTKRWRRILFYSIVAALIAILSFGRSAWINARFAAVQESQGRVLHTMDVLRTLKEFHVALELNHRNFDNLVALGNAEFFGGYMATKQTCYGKLAQAGLLTADNPEQQKRVRELASRVDRLFRYRDGVLSRVTRSRPDVRQTTSLLSRETEHRLVLLVTEPIAREEERLLRERQANLTFLTERFKRTTILNGFIYLLLILTLLGLVASGFGTASNDARKALDAMLQAMGKALEYRDDQTGGHVERVHTMAMRLAQIMAAPEKSLERFSMGVRLHDVGKIGIPDVILLKPGRLDPEERVVVERHVEIGMELVKPLVQFVEATDVIRSHHERWDGNGYPYRLKGSEIPWGGRYFAVIDVYDALRSRRPYKEPMTHEEAIGYIESQSGKHFDPEVVKAFVENIEEITRGIEWA